MGTQSLLLQGLVFSGVAIGAIVLLAWWLYASPLKSSGAGVHPAPARTAHTLALLIGAGALLISIGGYWDASEHVVTGIVPGGDDFLWPPHLMLYAGFLISFVVALGGLIVLAVPNMRAGVRDPRHWVRRSPYVGAVVLAAGYGLLSVPGDAIWHELFGIDLTAWSPPHIFLVVASSSTPLFATGLLLQARRHERRTEGSHGFLPLFLLALMLSELYLIAVLEWEIGRVGGYVAQRPIWLYPVLTGSVAFFVLALARRLVPLPWTATVLSLLFFAWRIGVTSFAEIVSGAPPRLTLVFVLGAILLDLVAQRTRLRGWRRILAEAAAFTIGYTLVALPTIEIFLTPYLPRFDLADHLIAVCVTLAACVLLQYVANRIGDWLLQHREGEMVQFEQTVRTDTTVPVA